MPTRNMCIICQKYCGISQFVCPYPAIKVGGENIICFFGESKSKAVRRKPPPISSFFPTLADNTPRVVVAE